MNVLVAKSLMLTSLFFVLMKILTGDILYVALAGFALFVCFLFCFKRLLVCCLIGICFAGVYILLFGFLNVDVEGRDYFLYFYYFVFSILLVLCINKLRFDYYASVFLLTVSLAWVLYQIVTIGYNPDAYNNLIDGSRNYVSGYLILFLIYYMFACHMNGVNVNLLYSFIVLVACFFLYGRSGVALSCVLFIISIFHCGGRFKKSAIAIAVLILSAFYFSDVLNFLNNSNFSQGAETERTAMLYQYLSSISSVRDFIFGMDFFSCCSLIMKFDGNPHNSFLMMHSRFGIFPFLIIVLFYLYQAFCGALIKNRYLNLLLLLVFARYFIDSIGFFGPVDFIVFSIVWGVLLTRKLSGFYAERSV